MREPADEARIRRFMACGRAAEADVRIYLAGGATAVLVGWRPSTIDVDFAMRPEDPAVLRAVPAIKEQLQLNLETEQGSPADFIPLPAGWEDRSPFVARAGRASFHHFDLYAQALAKVERGHAQDLADVRAMLERGLVDPARAREYFARIEPELYRFPAIDPLTFRRAVEDAFGG